MFTNTSANAQWTRKADELTKRAEANNVIYHNKMYVFGGFGDNPVIEKTNQVYDIAKNTWSKIAPVPAGKEITHQGVVLIDDNIWLIGGRAVNAYGPVSSQVIIYNITTNTWKNGPELIDPSTGQPFPIGAAGYILLGRTLHVFGGFGPTICEDQSTLHLTLDVDKYLADPTTTWENKLAPLPYPRHHISYVTLGGKIYVFGGQFKHDCGAVDQKYCHVYDPVTDQWTRLTDLPAPRSHAEGATFAVDGKMFLVGGQGANNVTQNTVYQFNPVANNNAGSWTNLTAYKLPGNYLGLSSKISGKTFIITNGALNSSLNERKETYVANVNRTSVRTFGFANSCFSESVDSDQEIYVHNLLYTIEDTCSYHLTSNAKWLTFSQKDGRGVAVLNGLDIKAIINTTGLSPGAYSGKITAIGKLASQTASFCVNLNVTSQNGYTLSVSTTGSGSVSKDPSQFEYEEDSTVVLTALPATGWKFNGWGGDTSATTNPLPVIMHKNRHITAAFIPVTTSNVLITNIHSTTGKAYRAGTLAVDTPYYTDRTYKVTSVPGYLNRAPFIKTPNDDKANKATNTLSFYLNKGATLYVGYDPRGAILPTWLNGWTKLTDVVGCNEPAFSAFLLYSKDFSAGQITLGGNLASPAVGAISEYIVIAVQKDTSDSMSKTPVLNKNGIGQSTALNVAPGEFESTAKSGKPFLYPNPTHGDVQIMLPDGYKGVSDLRLTDVNGNIHRFKNSLYNPTDKTINLNISSFSLRPGMYFMLISSFDGKTEVINMEVK